MSINPYSDSVDPSTGSGPCPPCPPTGNTFTITDKIQRGDATKMPLLLLKSDIVQRSDNKLITSMALNETLQRGDVYRLPSISVKPSETLRRSDSAIFTVGPEYAIPRGTDTDDHGDAWTDGLLANQGVNHGTTDPLTVANVTSATEQRAFIEINFSRFTGLTAIGNNHTFGFRANSTAGLVTTNVTLNFGAQASRWFTESTLTWSNQPATPTLFTKAVAVAVNAAYPMYTVTLTDAQMQQLLGKWALIVFTAPTGDTGTSILSRKNGATSPSRWNYQFKAQV